jgi:hypothetical protein
VYSGIQAIFFIHFFHHALHSNHLASATEFECDALAVMGRNEDRTLSVNDRSALFFDSHPQNGWMCKWISVACDAGVR